MDPNYTNPASSPLPEEKPEEKSGGTVIAIIIIVVIVLAGGFYLWRSGVLKKNTPVVTPVAESQATSEIAGLEASLNTIDVGSDSELNQLETQF